MFDGNRLLISIPARELAPNIPTGSIFPFAELRGFTVSSELAAGLDLLEAACEVAGSTITVVARPEMFTHGAALEWLIERLEGAKHHLCFSDGEAVRLVPGRLNNVFFYRGGIARCRRALADLERRAPELFGQLGSQVNSTYLFSKRLKLVLLSQTSTDRHAHSFLPFFTSRGGISRDLQLLVAQDSADLDCIVIPDSTTYVACTETALETPAYMSALVADLTEAYLDPARCLIIEAPNPDRTVSQPENRLELLLASLHRHAPSLPSGLPSNVFVHMQGNVALPLPLRGGHIRLIAHDTYPFWQRTGDFYSSFSELIVLRDKSSRLHNSLFRTMLERVSGRTWTELALPSINSPRHNRFRW